MSWWRRPGPSIRAWRWKSSRDGTPHVGPKQRLDISRAKEHLGWEPRFDLEAALRDYVKDLDAMEA